MDETPERVMARETVVRHGPVPEAVKGHVVAVGHHWMAGDEFLLREPGFACHYRRGQGLTVQLDDPDAAGALELQLAGTVHSAIASLNGLLPIHASAVAVGGRAIGFTGAPGAGKSTTAAALRQRGLAIVADDTLVIDPSARPPQCLPGHKRLKLWPDSLELTGMAGQELVSERYPKFFATSEGSEVTEPLPLGALVALQVGEEPALEAVRGAQRIALLDDDHYTAQLHALAHGHDRAGRLALLAQVANAVPVYRFTRPVDSERFTESIDFLIHAVSQVPPL